MTTKAWSNVPEGVLIRRPLNLSLRSCIAPQGVKALASA